MKLARGVVVALLVLMVAVTPISAMFRPGYFETSLRDPTGSWPQTRFALDDQTGLVMSFVAVAQSPTTLADDRLLVVSWLGGCSEQLVTLTFRATDGGYIIDKRSVEFGCAFLVGLSRTMVVTLRSPVDVTTVKFDAIEGSVR